MDLKKIFTNTYRKNLGTIEPVNVAFAQDIKALVNCLNDACKNFLEFEISENFSDPSSIMLGCRNISSDERTTVHLSMAEEGDRKLVSVGYRFADNTRMFDIVSNREFEEIQQKIIEEVAASFARNEMNRRFIEMMKSHFR